MSEQENWECYECGKTGFVSLARKRAKCPHEVSGKTGSIPHARKERMSVESFMENGPRLSREETASDHLETYESAWRTDYSVLIPSDIFHSFIP